MAFSQKDKDFLKGLPGNTSFLDDVNDQPLKGSNRVYIQNSKGFEKNVGANDMKELAHSLKKDADNFNVEAETRKFALTVEGTDEYKWVDHTRREVIDKIQEAMAKFPEELKLRGEIIEAYLEDNQIKVDRLVEQLKELDAEPIKKPDETV